MKIYFLLRDLEDGLKMANIELPKRKKYLLERTLNMLRKIQKHILNWTLTKLIGVANIITRLYNETKELKEAY